MDWSDLFLNYTVRTVAAGAAVLGITSGVLGSFALLRRQSLLGDAMSHAALPGVVLAFMVTRSKDPFVLLLGAAAAGLLSTLLLIAIVRYTRIKEDAALGILLSVFFGFGLMLLTFLQNNPDSRQAGLNTFLFGQAATLLTRDVQVMAGAGAVALLLVALFWKEFKLLSFDADFGASLGFPMRALEILLTFLLVIAIVIGLQAVGVVLMSAMVVAPAAAARQWTNRLAVMIGLAALFGALAGVSGALISSVGRGLATGPLVVLMASLLVIGSLLVAPERGLVWAWLKHQRNRRNLRVKPVLIDLYRLASQHSRWEHPHSIEALRTIGRRRGGVRASLNILAELGLVEAVDGMSWTLTAAGVAEAQRLLQREAPAEEEVG